ncbi:MAG TPA: hypothetical protein DHU96_18395 [Actinobacteria bacterium]|nr:hypothetical protein [Actinomycetota bacterium]
MPPAHDTERLPGSYPRLTGRTRGWLGLPGLRPVALFFCWRRLAGDEPVARWHVLVVGQVERVVDAGLVRGCEQREHQRGGPAAGRFHTYARPVLVFAQVRAGHGGGTGSVQAGGACVAVDLLGASSKKPNAW